jgi:transposase InsO family protein
LNQLWVADITYIAIATGFVYLAAILDAWSRRVVGYAIGKRIDARLALCTAPGVTKISQSAVITLELLPTKARAFT